MVCVCVPTIKEGKIVLELGMRVFFKGEKVAVG